MQRVFGVGRIQGRRAGIELVGLEAVPGALDPLGRPKQQPSLVLGPQGRAKSQQNQSGAESEPQKDRRFPRAQTCNKPLPYYCR